MGVFDLLDSDSSEVPRTDCVLLYTCTLISCAIYHLQNTCIRIYICLHSNYVFYCIVNFIVRSQFLVRWY